LMCVMVCFSMGFPQISLGPLGRMKWWSRMKWMHNAQLQVAGCGLGALYRNKKDIVFAIAAKIQFWTRCSAGHAFRRNHVRNSWPCINMSQ
jgi:hypothetical protein